MKYPQWFFDQTSLEHATGMGIPKPRKLAQPKFFEKSAKSLKAKRAIRAGTAQSNQAWDTALAPLKQLPISIAMVYFSGNSIQVVNLSMIGYGLFISPLTQILTSSRTFGQFRTKDNDASVTRAQIVSILVSLLVISLGVWKVSTMGLLPVHKKDWVFWEEPVRYKEKLDY